MRLCHSATCIPGAGIYRIGGGIVGWGKPVEKDGRLKPGRRAGTKKDRRECGGLSFDGGAGNRTLVRIGIQNRVYVRRQDFLPSPRAGNQPTCPGSISRNLIPAARASVRTSPDLRFDTDAPDGLQMPKVREARLAQLTQPVPVQYWQVNRSKRFNQEPGPGHAATSSTNPSKPVAPDPGILPGSGSRDNSGTGSRSL